MAASEGLTFSVASVVEDVLQQHGNRHRGLDLESRRAEEAASRRNDAASWLRKMVGVVASRDLPAEPSEEEFRLGLRSGLILCNALNRVQPGAITKVVESPNDPAALPDGAALSAYQYFENVRNFLVAAAEMGLPTFESSDLEQGGISARVLNSVLALKSYYEWKQNGGNGIWKFCGNVKVTTTVKQFVRKNSEPFTSPLSRTSSMNEKFSNSPSHDVNTNQMATSRSLSALVHALLFDKKPEEVPQLVESVLSKVVEEFEHRISTQSEMVNQHKVTSTKDISASQGRMPLSKIFNDKRKVDDGAQSFNMKPECQLNNQNSIEQSKQLILKQQIIFDRQGKECQDLKKTLATTKAGMQYMQMKFQEELQKLGMHIHGLASAASGYHRVLEENRKLYNEVQDLKGSIRVYCRVRPFLNGQSSYLSTVDSIEEGCITIKTPSKYGKGHKSFTFNRVFGPSATQADVFADMQPLIQSVLDGYNVCIFAYGQTGSGKTHTMSGPRDLTEQSQGVNYRSLSDLFYLAEQRKDTFQYDVSVQMIEIYNEQVRDLLSNDALQKRLDIRNSSQNGVNVPDACLVRVSSTYDVINLMNLGQKNRTVGATALNDRSSRSHSCLTVHVQGKDLTTGAILRGCMHLVDLAGSERVNKSEVTGDRLKEAQHINKSLSALGDVIASLAQKNSHVPYRNSKLTQLLQDSLGGQAKTLMFVHISPEPEATGETISTLKFAERVATVELGAAQVNKDGNTDVKELKEQIANLKAALAKKEGEQTYASPEVYRMKARGPSPLRLDQQTQQILVDNRNRQRVGGLSNKEVCTNSAPRRRTQSFDLDELSGTSSPWPPVNSPGHYYGEDDKEMTSSGDWVDKVMVNRQEAPARAEYTSPSNLPDSFYQEFCTDSSNLYSQQSFTMFSGFTQVENADELDELDAATSDSSEPDLLWHFNHSKLHSLPSGVGSKKKKPESRTTKSTDISKSMIPTPPSRKLANGIDSQLQRNGRHLQLPAEAKRKNGSRK